MTRLKGESGYTITELLVVLVILGLIAAAISPQIIGRLDSSKVRAAQLQLDVVLASFDAFYVDVKRYPTSEEGVDALLVAPPNAAGWSGPYVRSARNLTDPWGQRLVYNLDDAGYPTIRTYGSDKKEGGKGNAADLAAPEPVEQQVPGS
jgi:general secretion pathway protein G